MIAMDKRSSESATLTRAVIRDQGCVRQDRSDNGSSVAAADRLKSATSGTPARPVLSTSKDVPGVRAVTAIPQ
jgi:hypothetical protein